jgi:hypothetical protein
MRDRNAGDVVGMVRRALALVLVAKCAIGCGTPLMASDTGPSPDVDAAVTRLTLYGELYRFDTRDRLVDAQVCVLDEPTIPCVRSNDIGGFSVVGVARGSELVLEVAADDATYVPLRIQVRTGQNSDTIGSWVVIDHASFDAALTASGTSWDAAATGVAILDVHAGGFLLPYGWSPDGLAGASVAISSGDRVLYFADDGTLDTTLTSTSNFGSLLIFRATTDETELTLSHPGADCTLDDANGWPGVGADAFRALVAPGTLTSVGQFHCVVH